VIERLKVCGKGVDQDFAKPARCLAGGFYELALKM